MTQSPPNNSKSYILARVAILTSLALIFSYVEAIIPYNPGIPGVKLGISNVVIIVALYKYGFKEAVAISIIRVLLAGLLFNGMFGAIYSLAGSVLSILVMIGLKKVKIFSVLGISVAGAVAHNIGQLIVASMIIEDIRIFFYLPVLIFSGIAAGIAVGIASTIILNAGASNSI